MRRAVPLVFAAAALLTAPAQAYNDPIRVQSDQAELDRDIACRNATPADPDDVAKAHVRIEKVMQQLFALNASPKPGDFADLFDSDKPTWRDAGGAVPIAQLGAHMPATPPQRTLLAMVVAGDSMTARAVWSTDSGTYYAGDFVNHGWFGGWEIWHMTVSTAKPRMPPAYCHFDRDRSY